MSIIGKLASSLNRRDEAPNQELARQIADKNNKKAVAELVEHLTAKNKAVQSDCIKVLYEVGNIKPELIAGYGKEFVALLDSKNNRLQWGAMTALNAITTVRPEAVHAALERLTAAADKGSVITNDQYVAILIRLCAVKKYSQRAFVLLNERVLTCPANQLPMYAENALPVITDKSRPLFIRTLASRLGEIEKDTKRKRIEKVLEKLAGK